MKNWEKYEGEIKKIGLTFAVLKSSGEVVDCTFGFPSCEECLFGESNYSCEKDRAKWSYSDYKEPVVLTEDERKLCELFGDGWIARDSNGVLYYYHANPTKGKTMWADGFGYDIVNISSAFPQCKFEFIKWEDEEPWEVKI